MKGCFSVLTSETYSAMLHLSFLKNSYDSAGFEFSSWGPRRRFTPQFYSNLPVNREELNTTITKSKTECTFVILMTYTAESLFGAIFRA